MRRLTMGAVARLLLCVLGVALLFSVFGMTQPAKAATVGDIATFESGTTNGTDGCNDYASAGLSVVSGLNGNYGIATTGASQVCQLANYGGSGAGRYYFNDTEVYVSFLYRLDATPAATYPILHVQATDGSNVYKISVGTDRKPRLVAAGTTVGTGTAMTLGTTYRLGLHLKRSTPFASPGDGAIDAYEVAGNNAFGTPYYSVSSVSGVTGVGSPYIFGTIANKPVSGVYDDIQIDTAAMPSPLPNTLPTATPTAIPPTATPVPPTATPAPTSTPVTTVGNIATFEGNSATGSLGFNSVSATAPAVVTGLAGSYGVQVNSTGTSQYGLIGSSGVHPDVYVSFLYRLDATPTATTPFFFVGPTGSTNEVKLSIGTDNKIRMVYEGASATGFSSALTVGSTYRVGLHIHEDTTAGTTLVESYLASGNSAFGTAFNSTTEPKAFSGDEPFTFGTTTKALSSSYDNIQIDTSAMPAPLP